MKMFRSDLGNKEKHSFSGVIYISLFSNNEEFEIKGKKKL